MRDELMPGKEVATYWIEHVLRHGGTKHLQLSGKDMPFYQHYLLDVFALLLLITLLGLFAIYKLGKWIISKCFFRQKSVKKSKSH